MLPFCGRSGGSIAKKQKGSARGNWDPQEGQQPFRPNPNGAGDRTTTLRRLLIGAEIMFYNYIFINHVYIFINHVLRTMFLLQFFSFLAKLLLSLTSYRPNLICSHLYNSTATRSLNYLRHFLFSACSHHFITCSDNFDTPFQRHLSRVTDNLEHF